MARQKVNDAPRPEPNRSTGPKTAAGKAASRNNAYKHGMRTRTVLMPGEDPAEYNRLYDGMIEDYGVASLSRHEQFLIKQMADAHWRLERLKGIESALLNQDEIDSVELDRISRWQVRMENSFYKANKELKSIRKVEDATRAKEEHDKQEEEENSAGKPETVILYWKDPETGEMTLAPAFTEEDVKRADDEALAELERREARDRDRKGR